MRDIKFRGKSLRAGKWSKWIYGSLDCTKYTYKECRMVAYDDPIQYWHTVDKETIGQYTGLKDKNEKEIYEGDILELNKDGRIFYGTSDGLLAKKYQLVGFKDGAFMTCRNKHLIDDYDTYLWIISKYSTVAGNIYDNPELLEEGE